MIIRAVLPEWAKRDGLASVREGQFSYDEYQALNKQGYNIYFLPNEPTIYNASKFVSGAEIDKFNWLFVDMDTKDGKYTKESFLNAVCEFPLTPSRIVDSGNGVHVYWQVSDMDAMGYLRLQRRLMRKFDTDEAVCQIYQLMRVSGTNNTKDAAHIKPCTLIEDTYAIYTSEQMDAALPILSRDDEEYCIAHFNKTYDVTPKNEVVDKLPVKFGALLRENKEVKDLWTRNWSGSSDDRSSADYRIAHIMFASGFTKDEAMSTLVNSSKAQSRAPKHRVNYAENIVDKIWTYEIEKSTDKLSYSVKDLLKRSDLKGGTRFSCHPLFDDTVKGFRKGQVIGLVAGAGVGKTTVALNLFRWFIERNPEQIHFFVSLEQPAKEIAARWVTMCQGDESLHDKVHIIDNHGDDSAFRHLSLDDIKLYVLQFKKDNNCQVGTIVIDHIGVLKKQTKNGTNQGIEDICHQMKPFAVETDSMVIMQSQAPREKAGIGDLELNKDAAYGTVFFESYVDYLITVWQPLKRTYSKGAPTVIAYKFCKIRHKNQLLDNIKEDVCYQVYYDTQTEQLREMTQLEDESARHFLTQATNERKKDRKTDIIPYVSRRLDEQQKDTTNESV